MIQIDHEFRDLIPPLAEGEYSALEQSILADGCRDALVLWNDILIDGHNRYKICTEHNIAFETVLHDFASRGHAMLWMVKNQLARRNLTDFQKVELALIFEDMIELNEKAPAVQLKHKAP